MLGLGSVPHLRLSSMLWLASALLLLRVLPGTPHVATQLLLYQVEGHSLHQLLTRVWKNSAL